MCLRKKEVIILLVFFVQLIFVAPVFAGKVVMNFGWATSHDSAYGIKANKFKELAEKYTDGSVQVRLRPAGQIGGEDEAFMALRLGTVDAYIITNNNVSPHFPMMDAITANDSWHQFCCLPQKGPIFFPEDLVV